MAAVLTRVTGTSTGAGSNLTMAYAIPAEAQAGRLVVLTVSQERQAAGLTIQAVAGSTPWVIERNVTSGTAMTVVNAWKYLTAADIAAGEVRVNVTATRRMAMTMTLVTGGGTPTFTHAPFVTGSGTVNTIAHPTVTAPAGSLILDVAAVTSRAAQPLYPSTVEDPATDSWQRAFTPGTGWTFAAGAVQGTTQDGATTGAVNAYAYVATRTQATAGTVAAHTVTVDRSSNSTYASRVVIPPAVPGPVVSAGSPATVDAWAEDVPLAGTAADPSVGIASHTWRYVSSNPAGAVVTVTPGTNGTATYDAPGSLTDTALTFGYRATNTDGLTSAEVTVTHTVRAATEAWLHPTQGLRPLQQVSMADYTPKPPPAPVGNAAPVATFTTSTDGLTVVVDATASTDTDGTITGYAWAWGDGATDTGVGAAHTYAAAGAYTITLTVTDTGAATGATTRTVTVTAPPAPDTTKPTAVGGLTVTSSGITEGSDPATAYAVLAWTAATDPDPGTGQVVSGVNNYRVRKGTPQGTNMAYVAQPAGLTYTITGLTPGTAYGFSVEAYDKAGNVGPVTIVPHTAATAVVAAPILPLTDYGTIAAQYNVSTAVTAADATDATVQRVSSLPPVAGSLGALTQATATAQPALVTDPDGQRFLRFDGADRLSSASVAVARNVGALTLATRYRVAPGVGAGSRQLAFILGGANTARAYSVLFDGLPRAGGRRLDADANVFLTGTGDTRTSTWRTRVDVYDYANARLRVYVDGALNIDQAWQTAGVTSNTNGSLHLGATNTTAEALTGDIHTLVAYHTALTTAQAAELHRTLLAQSTATGAPVDPPPTVDEDPIPTPGDYTGIQDMVMANRALYPGANPELAHLPPLVNPDTLAILAPEQGGWPRVYWVGASSTFTAPADAPGYVHRDNKYFDPERSAGLKAYLGADNVAQVDCRHHTFLNVGAQEPGTRMRGAVFYGLNTRMTQWLNTTAATGARLYRTRADADAMTPLGHQGVTPGIWYLNPTEVTLDPNSQHTVNVKAVRGTLTTTGKAFRAFEGPLMEGPFAGEFNWAGGADTLLVLSAMHIERVSVYMQPDSASKRQGDGIQLFGGLEQVACRGLTVAATNYQAVFNQMTQGGVTPTRNVWTDVDVRWDLSDAVNGNTPAAGTGPQMFTGPDGSTAGMVYEVERVYLDPGIAGSRTRTRSQLIGGTHPGVVITDLTGVPHTVPADQVGVNYVLPEEL